MATADTGEGEAAVTTANSSGIVPTLQNLVATVNLGCKLTLQTIASKARNAEYNPRVRCAACWNNIKALTESWQQGAAVRPC